MVKYLNLASDAVLRRKVIRCHAVAIFQGKSIWRKTLLLLDNPWHNMAYKRALQTIGKKTIWRNQWNNFEKVGIYQTVSEGQIIGLNKDVVWLKRPHKKPQKVGK